MKPVVAIDGPAASGKGTVARRLAVALGLPYLDTGLLYRAVGRLVLDAGGDPDDPATAENAAISLRAADLERSDLRGPQADAAASSVAVVPGVRAALLMFQRDFAARCGAVLDGRDIGTVIFPDAAAKLFVTATLAERARRRWLELRAKGLDSDIVTVEEDIRQRDAKDAARATAPMQASPDAYLLDSSGMDAESVFLSALAFVRTRIAVG
jgi:cytidylate kinase